MLLAALIMTATAPTAATASPNAKTLEVLVRADLLSKDRGARMEVFINNNRISSTYVRNRNWSIRTLELPAPINPGDAVDIQFMNDESIKGEDRNLWVKEIRSNGNVMAAEEARYDIGDTRETMTDGENVKQGAQSLAWNGALRFKWLSPGLENDPDGKPDPTEEATSGLETQSAPLPRIRDLRPSAPVTAVSGQTIRGLRISCSAAQPAVTIPTGVTGVIVEDNEIGPCAPNVVGVYAAPGSSHITVRNNLIHGVATGFWASHARHPIVFESNTVLDILGPFPRGQMVQFDNVKSGSGQSRIVGNVSDWFSRTQPTNYEDHINTYMSSGTKGEPILIQGNKLRGGDSDTGSAIVVGDQGGHWYEIRDNIVVAVPNTGIGHVGGGNFTTVGNRIYNVYGPSIRTASAMTVWNTDSVYLERNRLIASYCEPGGECDLHMGFWRGPHISNVTEINNNWFDHSLNADIWNEHWDGDRWARR